MFNSKLPPTEELPTTRQLLRSTVIALGVAQLLLVTVVLPSEYAIDPTGIGRLLGLTEMGKIKASLAQEHEDEQKREAAPAVATPPPVAPVETDEKKVSLQTHEMSITLEPDQATEVKLEMRQGASVEYVWVAEGGLVNYDTHGDPYDSPKGFYHGYGKGLHQPGGAGVLTAAFDGHHGWFWRNRSGVTVTVRLKTSGDYLEIKKIF